MTGTSFSFATDQARPGAPWSDASAIDTITRQAIQGNDMRLAARMLTVPDSDVSVDGSPQGASEPYLRVYERGAPVGAKPLMTLSYSVNDQGRTTLTKVQGPDDEGKGMTTREGAELGRMQAAGINDLAMLQNIVALRTDENYSASEMVGGQLARAGIENGMKAQKFEI